MEVRITLEIRNDSEITAIAERVFAMPELQNYRPELQFRIAFEQGPRLGEFGVAVLGDAGPVEQQEAFGLFAVHGFGLSEGPAAARSAASSFWSCAMPRAMRDFTVPSGTPRISAISL